jgi:hypothetical protein
LHVPERVPNREAFPTYFATQCRLTTPRSGPPGGAAAERVRSPAAGTPSDLLISTGTVGSDVSVRTWRRQYCPSHFDAPTPCQIIRSRPPLDAFQSTVSHSFKATSIKSWVCCVHSNQGQACSDGQFRTRLVFEGYQRASTPACVTLISLENESGRDRKMRLKRRSGERSDR